MNIPVIGLVFVFLAGFGAGWLFGRVRLRANLNIALKQPGLTSDVKPSFVFSKTVRTMSLKCQCGETWRFHETSGHPDQRSQPMPEGDSFTCPNCARSIDLRELRKMLPNAQ